MHCNMEENLKAEIHWIFKISNRFGYKHNIIQQLINKMENKQMNNKEKQNCKFIGYHML